MPSKINFKICKFNKDNRKIFELKKIRRGVFDSKVEISGDRLILKYKLPLNEIIIDFFDKLKKATSGYARYV